MKKLQAARAAMVAMAALGIIASTPAYAAGLEASTASVYSNQPQHPTHPTEPDLPGPIVMATPPDVKVSYVSKTSNNGSMTWTYKVENLGQSTAKGVKMEKVAVRNCYCGSHGIQTETSYETLGDLPGGAVKNIVVSCAPKNLAPPCDSSSAEAHLTNTDSNPGNNWATS